MHTMVGNVMMVENRAEAVRNWWPSACCCQTFPRTSGFEPTRQPLRSLQGACVLTPSGTSCTVKPTYSLNPICLHTTWAYTSLKKSPHTVPHSPFIKISSLPLLSSGPPVRRKLRSGDSGDGPNTANKISYRENKLMSEWLSFTSHRNTFLFKQYLQ